MQNKERSAFFFESDHFEKQLQIFTFDLKNSLRFSSLLRLIQFSTKAPPFLYGKWQRKSVWPVGAPEFKDEKIVSPEKISGFSDGKFIWSFSEFGGISVNRMKFGDRLK